jgi:hypothetical protein
MSSMRSNAPLGTSHPFVDAWAVAGSLRGIRNAMVKCPFIVNKSCIHKGFRCPHRWRSKGFFSDEHEGHAVGPTLRIHRSWWMLLRTSRTARLKCAGVPSRVYHIRVLIACVTSPSNFGILSKRKSRYWWWWDMSRTLLNIMEDIIKYFKDTLSAAIIKSNVTRHILIWTFFHVLVCGTRTQSLFKSSSYTIKFSWTKQTWVATNGIYSKIGRKAGFTGRMMWKVD